MKIFKSTLGLLFIFSLISCGGNSEAPSNSVNTGKFIDSEVQGVAYKTSSGINGITNSSGEYQFKDGDNV